jgi:hypothetical protein
MLSEQIDKQDLNNKLSRQNVKRIIDVLHLVKLID